MPDRISPDVLAAALRGQGYRISGPSYRGAYTASTELCHGGDTANGLHIRLSNSGGFLARCFTRDCGAAGHQGEIGKRLLALAGIERDWQPADYRSDANTEYLAAVYQHPDGSTRREYRKDWPEDWPAVQQSCPYTPTGGQPCSRPRDDRHKHPWTAGGGQQGVLCRVVDAVNPGGPVILTEGAKAANALVAAGYNAANWLGGAGAAKDRADFSSLAGREVIVWPDADDSGVGEWAMRWAAYRLRDACPGIKAVPPYYAGGATADAADCPRGELAAHIAKAQPYSVDQQPPALPPRKGKPAAAAPPDTPSGTAVNPGKADWLKENTDFIPIANRIPWIPAVRLLTDERLAPDLVLTYRRETLAKEFDPAAFWTWNKHGRLEHAGDTLQRMLNDMRGELAMEIFNSPLEGKGLAIALGKAGQVNGWLDKIAQQAPGVVSSLRHYRPDKVPAVYEPDDLDTDRELLGCLDGVLDLRQWRIIPPAEARNRTPVTGNTGAHWNPHARHPVIDAVLPPLQRTEETLRAWQLYIGFCIARPVMRDVGMEIGPKAGGKTTRRLAIRAGLGNYARTIRTEALQINKMNRGGSAHNGDLLEFERPARIVFTPDAAGEYDLALINTLGGGEGDMRMRQIYQAGRDVQVSAHLLIQANNANLGIGLGDESEAAVALRDRMRLFQPATYPQPNPAFLLQLQPDQLTDELRDAAFLRLMEYAYAALDMNEPPKSETMKERIEQESRQAEPHWKGGLRREIMRDESDLDPLSHYKTLNSYHARQLAVEICKDHGEEWPTANAVTRFLQDLTGQKPREGKVAKDTTQGGKKASAQIFNGWIFRPDGN